MLNTVLYNRKEGSLLPVSPSDANSLFDRRIDLETEGIDSFFGSTEGDISG